MNNNQKNMMIKHHHLKNLFGKGWFCFHIELNFLGFNNKNIEN